MLIFEESQPGRAASAQMPDDVAVPADLPKELLRDTPVGLREVPELQAVRDYTNLSRKNFYTTPVRRLDDVKAARDLDLAYQGSAGPSKARAA